MKKLCTFLLVLMLVMPCLAVPEKNEAEISRTSNNEFLEEEIIAFIQGIFANSDLEIGIGIDQGDTLSLFIQKYTYPADPSIYAYDFWEAARNAEKVLEKYPNRFSHVLIRWMAMAHGEKRVAEMTIDLPE